MPPLLSNPGSLATLDSRTVQHHISGMLASNLSGSRSWDPRSLPNDCSMAWGLMQLRGSGNGVAPNLAWQNAGPGHTPRLPFITYLFHCLPLTSITQLLASANVDVSLAAGHVVTAITRQVR